MQKFTRIEKAADEVEGPGQMGAQAQTEAGGCPACAMAARVPAVAGQVCNVLRESGAQPLASLARRVPDVTTNEVAMAVGWLAHAGDIRFSRRGGLWMIELQRVSQGGTGNDSRTAAEA